MFLFAILLLTAFVDVSGLCVCSVCFAFSGRKQKGRAPKHYRDPSGRKPLNFHGVPLGDKSNVSVSMDNPWIIHGQSMDYPWTIHGSRMDYPWIIHGLSTNYRWIIFALSMDNAWIIH